MKKGYKAEVAARITAHLKRFERDKTINAKRPSCGNTGPYYNPHCVPVPRGFSVIYVSYQGTIKLTTEAGELYLVWLDEGNVGTHWEALKAGTNDEKEKEGKR